MADRPWPAWRCPYGGIVVSACKLPRGHAGHHERRRCRACGSHHIEMVPPRCRRCGAAYDEELDRPPQACAHCGQHPIGPLIWWAQSNIIRTLEGLGIVKVPLFCDACVTCAGCGQYVAPGSGMPPSPRLPALHRACLQTPAGRAALSELRRMLGGGGSN